MIAISNPSSEPIKLVLQDEPGQSIPLATVTLQYLRTPLNAKMASSGHLPARVDILEKYLYDVSEAKSIRTLIKNFWYRIRHMKDYYLTVHLVTQLKKMIDIQPEKWREQLKLLEEKVQAQKIRRNGFRDWLQSMIPFIPRVLAIAILIVTVYMAYPGENFGGTQRGEYNTLIIIETFVCLLTFILK